MSEQCKYYCRVCGAEVIAGPYIAPEACSACQLAANAEIARKANGEHDLLMQLRMRWKKVNASAGPAAATAAWKRAEPVVEESPNGHDEQPACPICSKRAARMKRLPQWFHDLADLVDTSDDWVCENPDAIHRVLEHLDYSVLEDLVGCLVDMVEELKKTT